MRLFRISSVAESDIEDILAWTHERFGEAARVRYEALIAQAIIDIASNPDRNGCTPRHELAKSASTYHLHWSRNQVSEATGRVKRPRHFLLYRIADNGTIEIGRVLHDSMELARHLPTDFDEPV
ncbi:MAG TPA: plasmid stabilization protein ParE [Planctomycetaceae bacterium]|nr:plasmid stabilization protein ParE [Planctomycetaceae bacterium]